MATILPIFSRQDTGFNIAGIDLVRVDVQCEAVLLADHLVAPHPLGRLQAPLPPRRVQRPLPLHRPLRRSEPQPPHRRLRVRDPGEGVEFLPPFRSAKFIIVFICINSVSVAYIPAEPLMTPCFTLTMMGSSSSFGSTSLASARHVMNSTNNHRCAMSRVSSKFTCCGKCTVLIHLLACCCCNT